MDSQHDAQRRAAADESRSQRHAPLTGADGDLIVTQETARGEAAITIGGAGGIGPPILEDVVEPDRSL